MSDDKQKHQSFWSLFSETRDAPSNLPSFLKLFGATSSSQVSPRPQESPAALFFNEKMVYWAMRNLPVSEAIKHFSVCGAIGSGKTTAIQLFLQSIAPRFKADWKVPEQLIIFDAKSDMIPILAGLGLGPEEDNVWIFNPYDARGAIWSIAEAVQTPMMARHLATLLVPEEKRSNAPYFADGARELVVAVILGLNSVAGDTWTLRDLLCALDSRDHIAAVAAQNPRAKILAARFLGDELHALGVISTLASKLGKFEQVAALWKSRCHARQFSILEFLKKPGVLILGNDPVLRESLWPINAILLKALTEEILRRPDLLEPRHWFILDEFRAMQQVDCIHDLLNLGRSKGASVLLGFQSFEGLSAIYGAPNTNDMLSHCTTKTFLRAGGPETAEWVEKFFGQIRRTEMEVSKSWGPSGSSYTQQFSTKERSLFLASFFLNLPLPVPGKDYVAVSDVPYLDRVCISARPFDDILSWRKPKANIPGVLPCNEPDNQTLAPWTDDEETFFCRDSSSNPKKKPKPAIAAKKPEKSSFKPPARHSRRG